MRSGGGECALSFLVQFESRCVGLRSREECAESYSSSMVSLMMVTMDIRGPVD